MLCNVFCGFQEMLYQNKISIGSNMYCIKVKDDHVKKINLKKIVPLLFCPKLY